MTYDLRKNYFNIDLDKTSFYIPKLLILSFEFKQKLLKIFNIN